MQASKTTNKITYYYFAFALTFTLPAIPLALLLGNAITATLLTINLTLLLLLRHAFYIHAEITALRTARANTPTPQ